VTDPVIFSLGERSAEPDRLGAYYDFASTENRSADFAPGLVSLGFIMAALRRSARLLTVLAIVGLILGVGDYKARPHQFQATATVLLTLSDYENSQTAPADDEAIAETRAVAGLAVQDFGLKQTVSSLLSSYSAVSSTDRLLTVTASAPSSDLAVLRANAVASAFLKFRASELQDQQNLIQQSLNQQVTLAKRRVNSIDAQMSQLSRQPTSPTQQAELGDLAATQKLDNDTLGTEEAAATANQTTVLAALTAALKNSQILSVVPLPHSKLKPLITYGVLGLFGGLAVGFAIIVIRALASDRLRRRDDIAYTIDAPVRLSVGRLHKRRLQIAWPGRKARREHDMKRLIAHLQSAVPRNTRGPAGLAIVAVDNAPVVARAVAALAASCVAEGNQLVTVDLSDGAYLAQLLGSKKPGTHPVSRGGANFTMTVPDRHDPGPVGPLLPSIASPAGSGQARDELAASYGSADLLLTLATLNPALGGDYLATWATNAVVMVSAGQSSAERIHGVGEMIRLAGLRLESVVLIEADKRDESLGLMRRPDEHAGIGVLGR
jgi:capsular polysaccharide biosynthesis protein